MKGTFDGIEYQKSDSTHIQGVKNNYTPKNSIGDNGSFVKYTPTKITAIVSVEGNEEFEIDISREIKDFLHSKGVKKITQKSATKFCDERLKGKEVTLSPDASYITDLNKFLY